MTFFTLKQLGLGLLGALLSATAGASTLYKCTDESGVVLFTNQPTAKKKCSVISVQTPPAPSSPRSDSGATSAPRARSSATANPTPSDFPRVSGDQQKARDTDRRAILEREMAAEQASLEKARLALGPQPAQAPQAARDTVLLHERNIEALNKELAKLR
jgi:hypothetical protein